MTEILVGAVVLIAVMVEAMRDKREVKPPESHEQEDDK